MDLLSELKELGANTEEGLTRCMNNASLYERLLKKVPANVESLEVIPFIDTNDIEKATTNAHTLKGVMGNMSITPLFTAYTEIVNLLRADKPAEARQLLVDIMPLQEQVVACIKKYC